MPVNKNLKIAIVHDYFYSYGGAERTVEVLHELYPDVPIYTSYFVPSAFPDYFQKWDIRESFLGKTKLKNTIVRRFFTPLCPFAIESLDLSEFDIIISSSSGPAKGVKKIGNARHLAYIHTPPWFEWGIAKPRLRRKVYLWLMKNLDFQASQRPNVMIANSSIVKQRILDFYKRDSLIIHPPVEIKKLQSFLPATIQKENYFVMGGRLELYKGVSRVAKFLDSLDIKLKIIGKGPDAENLKGLSNNIEYLGFVTDEEKALILAKAQALLFWNVEDFGITMVEALACGTPIIAYGEGGALDIIIDGETGILFKEQSESALKSALDRYYSLSFDQDKLKPHAQNFSKEVFMQHIKDIVQANSRKY